MFIQIGTTKGTGGDVLILEEAAYCDEGFFYETVAPSFCMCQLDTKCTSYCLQHVDNNLQHTNSFCILMSQHCQSLCVPDKTNKTGECLAFVCIYLLGRPYSCEDKSYCAIAIQNRYYTNNQCSYYLLLAVLSDCLNICCIVCLLQTACKTQ